MSAHSFANLLDKLLRGFKRSLDVLFCKSGFHCKRITLRDVVVGDLLANLAELIERRIVCHGSSRRASRS